jgi:hypothetical protein
VGGHLGTPNISSFFQSARKLLKISIPAEKESRILNINLFYWINIVVIICRFSLKWPFQWGGRFSSTDNSKLNADKLNRW